MNATNQQLFMVPSFRRSILAIPGTEPPPAGSAASADERSSGAQAAYQLQRLFAFLQESEERAYDARPFYSVLKWRGDEGVGKVDPSAQQDASEYIMQLVEQLPDYEEPFKRHFGGTMQTELLATSGRSGERLRKKAGSEALFFFHQVVVKDRASLVESLQKDIEGELLDEYKWNEDTAEEERLPTTKRSYFQTLPPHLIFHLKVRALASLSLLSWSGVWFPRRSRYAALVRASTPRHVRTIERAIAVVMLPCAHSTRLHHLVSRAVLSALRVRHVVVAVQSVQGELPLRVSARAQSPPVHEGGLGRSGGIAAAPARGEWRRRRRWWSRVAA
jgi:hypothetical protein